MLAHYSQAKSLWFASPLAIRSEIIPGSSFKGWCLNLTTLGQGLGEHRFETLYLILWRIGKARNDQVFNKKI